MTSVFHTHLIRCILKGYLWVTGENLARCESSLGLEVISSKSFSSMCYRSGPRELWCQESLLVGASVTDTPCGVTSGGTEGKWAEMMAQGLGLEDKNPQRGEG